MSWNHSAPWSRRRVLQLGAAAVLGSQQAFAVAAKKLPKLRPAVKYSMIKVPGATVLEKFELVKKIGFLGLEIQAPGEVDTAEAIAASKATGIKIHGVVDAVHWNIRLSDRDASVRAEAIRHLQTAIRTAQAVGAGTVLIVPGKVTDPKHENWDQVWERSQAGIRACIPSAKECNVVLGVETVWNDFITKPEHLMRYVDEINSRYVGAYFDSSNMLKYGVSSAEWIRKLGPRLVKFDLKGYSKKTGSSAPIGEGDEDWPEILAALGELNYDGWATSEVTGGGEAELRDIYDRMQRVLGSAY
jgi:L-ribulose-5-phosphate 3-epimerase